MNRWKNKGLWLSIFAFIALMAKTFNLFEIPANYDELVNMFLGILVGLGILSNPTTENTGYLDDK